LINNYFIAVIGGSQVSKKIYNMAYKVGCEIAKNNGILINGGLSGVMEASSRGAKENGGLTVGILPGKDKKDANNYVDIPVATGIGEARNVIIINMADGVIAIDGEYGTLSEIAFALKKEKPIVGINTFDFKEIYSVNSPEMAVKKIIEMIESKKEGKR
jgi:uncharacterized protein (TIGR00725 family)